jgi:hypothetical protein
MLDIGSITPHQHISELTSSKDTTPSVLHRRTDTDVSSHVWAPPSIITLCYYGYYTATSLPTATKRKLPPPQYTLGSSAGRKTESTTTTISVSVFECPSLVWLGVCGDQWFPKHGSGLSHIRRTEDLLHNSNWFPNAPRYSVDEPTHDAISLHRVVRVDHGRHYYR